MTYPIPIYDGHNHLHDARLSSQLPAIIDILEEFPVRKAVVNGTRPEDWEAVIDLAEKRPWVLPSIGLHPWYVQAAPLDWRERFVGIIDSGRCAVGEIGLDRWIENHDFSAQEAAFRWQLEQAANRNLPATIHCLRAWGRLLEVVQSEPLPKCGFLIHSYGGPAGMVQQFADLGGYFSLSGYFAHERKERQREVFRQVPLDRLILETDAPDMLPPRSMQLHFVSDSHGSEMNHPANIGAVYEFAASLYNISMEELASIIESNFHRLFSPLLGGL